MNNKMLREELQKVASCAEISCHARKIEDLCAIYNCSIKVIREYEANAKETFNCFEYALALNLNVCIRIRRDLADFGVPVDCHFIDYLRQLGDLLEIEEPKLEENDLIIYFWNLKAQHAGRWNNGRVTSG